jgi:hypothetical protein
VEWETKSKEATDADTKSTCNYNAELSFQRSLAIEAAVINVGKRFNPRFDEVKFRQACNPDISMPI